MKFTWCFFLIFPFFVFGQNTQDSKIDPVISNPQKTSSYTDVPATRAALILPEGFVWDKENKRYIKDKKSEIQVHESMGFAPPNGFEKEYFTEELHATVTEIKDIKVNGHQGQYIVFNDGKNHESTWMYFGDENFMFIISSIYEQKDTLTKAAIIKSFNSVFFDSSRTMDPVERTYFQLEDKASKFKYSRAQGDFLIYTIDGKEFAEMNGSAYAVFMPMAMPILTLEEITAESVERVIKQTGEQIKEVKQMGETNLNGYHAYQAEYTTQVENHNKLYYELSVIHKNNLILIHFESPSNNEKEFEEFKKLIQTLRFK